MLKQITKTLMQAANSEKFNQFHLTYFLWSMSLIHFQSRLIFSPSAGVKLDPSKAWCPVLECQAVCSVQPSSEGQPAAVPCPTCRTVFCSGCRGPWQDGHACPEQQPMMTPSHESRSVSRPFGPLPACPPAATELRFANDTELKPERVRPGHWDTLVMAARDETTEANSYFSAVLHLLSMHFIRTIWCRMFTLNGSYKRCVVARPSADTLWCMKTLFQD